ncbi:MAG: S8 family serine peptidase, partial [Phaeodactylibacter sp.]|nr:S8 family serine peptidase [Phaeodactylibacter sp.]
TTTTWIWSADGTASSGQYWGERTAIQSTSGGGAALFDADGQNPNGQLPFPQHNATLTSPNIRATIRMDRVFLSYYQYFRSFNATGRVELYGDTNADGQADTWVDLSGQALLGRDVSAMPQNTETANADFVVFDITALAAGVRNVRLRFTYSGDYYFWLIDDVVVSSQNPFPATYPPSLGEELLAGGYGYAVDSLGGAYKPDELVIYWNLVDTTVAGNVDPVDETDKQLIRDQYGIDSFLVCPCDPRLELWVIEPAPGSPNPTADENFIDIFGIKEGAKTESETMGIDNNYFNSSNIDTRATGPNPALTDLPPGITDNSPEDVLIAILDTGIDYTEPDLVKNIWKNPDGSDFGANDYIGWNLADWNNNPMDNSPNIHGSSVARVVHHTMVKTNCEFKLMPIKTHDPSGVSSLFNVTCGTYYAIKEGAQIINYSWGWSGAPNEVLLIAVQTALENNVTITAAAGNDGLKIDSVLVYPACYPVENMVAVAALKRDATGKLIASSISNYSPEYIDLAALGEGVDVLGLCESITGTSFSAPYVAAIAAFAYAEGTTPPGKPVWDHLRSCGGLHQDPLLDTLVTGGRVLPLDETCL